MNEKTTEVIESAELIEGVWDVTTEFLQVGDSDVINLGNVNRVYHYLNSSGDPVTQVWFVGDSAPRVWSGKEALAIWDELRGEV